MIAQVLLVMTRRITMLGISHWTEKGGKYRKIQRFFGKASDWVSLNWVIAKIALQKRTGAILIAGDAITVTK